MDSMVNQTFLAVFKRYTGAIHLGLDVRDHMKHDATIGPQLVAQSKTRSRILALADPVDKTRRGDN